MTTTALAIREDQSQFDDSQRQALVTLGVDEGCPPAMLQIYLNYAQRTQLDPFQRQIYLIGRKDGAASKKAGHDVLKYTIQTGIDGFRVIARRAADRARVGYSEESAQWCGEDEVWRDVWLKSEPPAAARFVICRGDGERFTGLAHWAEYAETEWESTKPKGMWKSRGAGQLIKCAEALALRKAFPNDLGGMYTDDEMAHTEDRKGGATTTVTQQRPQRLAQRVAVASTPAPEPEPEPEQPEADVDAVLNEIAQCEDQARLRELYAEYRWHAEIVAAITVQVDLLKKASA